MAEVQEITVDIDALKGVIEEEYNNDPENVIMILQAIQRSYNYLPRPSLEYLSEKIAIPIFSTFITNGNRYSSQQDIRCCYILQYVQS